MERKTAIITSCLVTVTLIIITTAYFLWPQGETFTVTFRDSKHLQPGANVYLSGIDIGEVKAVDFSGGNINVRVRLSKENNGKIPSNTLFFIDKDSDNPTTMCILAKSPDQPGAPIQEGDILEGTDGLLAWKLSEVAANIRNSLDSPQTRQFVGKIKLLASDFNKQLQEIDWDQLGKDIKSETQSLIKDINQVLQSEEFQQNLDELQGRINRLEQVLKKTGDSEEAHRLLEALKNLYGKLNEELSKEERTNDQKKS